MQTSANITFAGTNGNNFAFIRVLGIAGREIDPAGSLNFLGCSFHQNAIAKRFEGSKKSLCISKSLWETDYESRVQAAWSRLKSRKTVQPQIKIIKVQCPSIGWNRGACTPPCTHVFVLFSVFLPHQFFVHWSCRIPIQTYVGYLSKSSTVGQTSFSSPDFPCPINPQSFCRHERTTSQPIVVVPSVGAWRYCHLRECGTWWSCERFKSVTEKKNEKECWAGIWSVDGAIWGYRIPTWCE